MLRTVLPSTVVAKYELMAHVAPNLFAFYQRSIEIENDAARGVC